jgi:hypothetical protein
MIRSDTFAEEFPADAAAVPLPRVCERPAFVYVCFANMQQVDTEKSVNGQYIHAI